MNNNTKSQEAKVCTKCSSKLSIENFRKHHAQCRPCEYKAAKEWREKNKEKIKANEQKYREENREIILQRKKMYLEKNKEAEKKRKREDYYKNKEQRQAKHKEWLENNKDKTLARQKEYYKEKPEVFAEIRQRRRSHKKNVEHNFSWEEWEICLEQFEHKCAYCGKKKKLEQEHFIPLNNGGEFTANNIIPACKSCNSSKCDHDFFEWYPNKPYYSKQRENKILKYLTYDNNKQQLALFK